MASQVVGQYPGPAVCNLREGLSRLSDSQLMVVNRLISRRAELVRQMAVVTYEMQSACQSGSLVAFRAAHACAARLRGECDGLGRAIDVAVETFLLESR